MSEIKEINNDYKTIVDGQDKVKKYDNYGVVFAVATLGSIVSSVFAPSGSALESVAAIGVVGGFTAFTGTAIAKTRLKIKNRKQQTSFVVKHGNKEDVSKVKQLNDEYSKNWKTSIFNIGLAGTTTLAVLNTVPLITELTFSRGLGVSLGITVGLIAGLKNSGLTKKMRNASIQRDNIIDKTIAERVAEKALGEVEKINLALNKSPFKGPK